MSASLSLAPRWRGSARLWRGQWWSVVEPRAWRTAPTPGPPSHAPEEQEGCVRKSRGRVKKMSEDIGDNR